MTDHEQLETEARSGTSSRDIDQDDVSEQLDDDKLSGEFPPDDPVAADDYGITSQEQRVPEPIEERVEREQPEGDTVGEVDGVGHLVAPDEGDLRDTERDAVADDIDAVSDHDRTVGDVGTGDITTAETAPEMQPDMTAEEAAVHQRPEP